MRRIRSIKPEWLEDERLAMCSSDARVLTIALILLADDHGRGRASALMLSGTVFPGKNIEILANALDELVRARFVTLYEVDEQHYFEIRSWEKHQKVDKPGKPKVPANPGSSETVEKSRETLANSRASRDPIPSLPGPDPDPIPEGGPGGNQLPPPEHSGVLHEVPLRSEARRPWVTLADVLALPETEREAIPLMQRCSLIERHASDVQAISFWEPREWSGIKTLVEALSAAEGGHMPRLGPYGRDAGVRAVVGLLATVPLEEALEAIPRIVADEWWQRARPGLCGLTITQVRKAQGPPPKAVKRSGATPTQPNYGVPFDAEEYQ